MSSASLEASSAERCKGNSASPQDTDRGDIVLRYTSVKRSSRFQAEESGERVGGHSVTSPKGAVDPVADLSFPFDVQLPMFPAI